MCELRKHTKQSWELGMFSYWINQCKNPIIWEKSWFKDKFDQQQLNLSTDMKTLKHPWSNLIYLLNSIFKVQSLRYSSYSIGCHWYRCHVRLWIDICGTQRNYISIIKQAFRANKIETCVLVVAIMIVVKYCDKR